MSTFKFTPKRGVLANVTQFVRSTSATAAISAANGLAVVQGINKAVTDGLAIVDVAEEMAMNNMANFFTEQLGEEVTVQDIREGDLSEKISIANNNERIYAAKKGQYERAKKAIKLGKKIAKLEKKLALLEQK